MKITQGQLKLIIREELLSELHGKLPNMTAEESEKVWVTQRQKVRETLAMYDDGPQDDESAQAAIDILQGEDMGAPSLLRADIGSRSGEGIRVSGHSRRITGQ